MPAVSVIVPVYNVEKCLHRCVDSVLAQTFADFELLLIDDGSPDNCGAICDEYAKKDSRVRVFHKENGGASSARNLGLDHAQGEYIMFCDSDDYIATDTLMEISSILDEYHADIVEFGLRFVEKNGEIIDHTPNLPIECVSGIELLPRIYQGSYGGSIYVCNKLYRAELFNAIRFEEGHIFEDTIIMPRLFFAAKKVAIVSKTYYSYCMEDNSIFRSAFSLKKLDCLYAFESNRNFYQENKLNSVIEYLDTTYAFVFVKMLKQLKKAYGKEYPQYRDIKKKYLSMMKIFLKNRKLNVRQKILLIYYDMVL